ncbi:BZ3500_MvSof-1268-A1-R1_Chr2-1g04690 [Microbotryum saponariae]|uniref:60S ribosome subunit biogenesis protein NIP7 n=1 Tax=Microbotryum saponariae TaxID=289078 RepID=A0A2X0MAP7_9BASI|nr:BZ3500_MvSof-1268-A1-R1_Chr2-1g04690 [Microbotryum saponariae]SCZ92328.1 BZ3501_MvSof-1269-A2-R1_Chr2-1g04346 [Microbotryum saponariae]
MTLGPLCIVRPLTESETKTLFSKLANYIGSNLVHLVDTPDDPHVFRLHRSRVYYVREEIIRQAISVPRANLISLGICLGKFSKTDKFRLHVTALDLLGRYAKNKVRDRSSCSAGVRCTVISRPVLAIAQIWIKANGEMPFLYGNHVVKAHLGKITEDTPEHQGVVVYSMTDIPLGFGVTARSTIDTRKLDPTAIIVFNQADVGEYLREEDTLF